MCCSFVCSMVNFLSFSLFFFFFNDTATTEIYTLSLHDALPISNRFPARIPAAAIPTPRWLSCWANRSEEHTSELQSHVNLVCRLLLEKKNICCRGGRSMSDFLVLALVIGSCFK